MAESSLSLTYQNLQSEVAHFLGYGRNTWDEEQKGDIEACITSGLRRFLLAHNWTFTKPTTSLTTSAPYSTGTIAATLGVVTISGGTAPTWAASGVLIHNGHSYSINTRDSGTQVTLDDLTVTITAGASYVISQRDYDLPDNFGQIIGPITYEPSYQHAPILIVGEGFIRQLRQQGSASSGLPRQAAVRPKAAALTTGQRWEIMFEPAPNAALVLAYQYLVLPGKLTPTNLYTYGGMLHAETLQACCLAAAELKMDDVKGAREQDAERAIASSIQLDNRSRAEHLPYCHDNSEGSAPVRPTDGYFRYQGQTW